MDDDLIGTAEAAAILGQSQHAIRGRAARGNLPHVRADNGRVVTYRFRRADILALAADIAAGRRRNAPRSEPAPPNGHLIGAKEAARILGVSNATVLNWANRGAFPAIKYEFAGSPAVYRFERADIAAFKERSRIGPAPASATDSTAEHDAQEGVDAVPPGRGR